MKNGLIGALTVIAALGIGAVAPATAGADEDAGIPIIGPATPLGPQPAPGGDLPYVVAPVQVSPQHGQLITNNPIFREPFLMWTDHGLVTAFMEIPSSDTSARLGWTCTSATGASWACSPVSRGPGGTDWADPWLADSRGDACSTYGAGLTMVALIAEQAQGYYVLRPEAYYSPNFGKTWVGPTPLPYPAPIGTDNQGPPIADGTKVIYTGHLFAAWRDFTFMTGAYVSELRPNCTWGPAIDVTTWDGPVTNPTPGFDDGSDHMRLAATPESGGLAVRASFDDNVLTFHRFDPFLNEEYESIIGPTSPADDAIYQCPMPQSCTQTDYDLGRTLLWMPSSHRYLAVWDKYDEGGPNVDATGLWTTSSTDVGHTWGSPDELAGPSVDGSYATLEPMMAYDKATGDAILTYYEVPLASSYTAYLELRVWHHGATSWSRAYRIRTLSYNSPHGSEQRFGDYLGLDTHGGVAYVDEGLYDQHGGHIEFFSVRYPK